VNAPARTVLKRLALLLLPVALLLPLTYLIPPLVRLDLAGSVALGAYWIAESGGTAGIPIIGAVMAALITSRPDLTVRRRLIEAALVVLALAAVLGGGAYVNEHAVKPTFAVARPNVVALGESKELKKSVEEFYALPDKAARSRHLDEVLARDGRMDGRVRAHWVAETGYSFPSGHSFSAMTFATFFVAMALACCSGWRLWAAMLLVPWAVLVCYSRPLLMVHSPTDVCVGALEGVAAGAAAFLFVRWASERSTAAKA